MECAMCCVRAATWQVSLWLVCRSHMSWLPNLNSVYMCVRVCLCCMCVVCVCVVCLCCMCVVCVCCVCVCCVCACVVCVHVLCVLHTCVCAHTHVCLHV